MKKALIITGYGTNSHKESAFAAQQAGFEAEVVHLADLVARKKLIEDYHLMVLPGGFLDGDDLGAALAAAKRWRYLKDAENVPLLDRLAKFIEDKKLILGICNGFQVLAKLGLLPAFDDKYFERTLSLAHNASAKYEDRWVKLKINKKSPCVFTQNINDDFLEMPVRHGEGQLVAEDQKYIQRLVKDELIVFQYADEQGEITMEYPANPNGSSLGIAGICDPSGRILGLMPHPEAFNHKTNHPNWTRGQEKTLATILFKNAYDYLDKN